MYYIGKEKKMLRYDSTDPDFVHMNNVLFNMCETDAISKEPWSMERYLIESGVAPRLMGMADAGYANTAGGSLARISYNYQCEAEK